jgi:hypothetical protein
MALTGTRPTITGHGGIEYLTFYVSGAVRVRRWQGGFASSMLYGAATSAAVTTGSDDGQHGLVKLRAHGNPLICAVPKAGVITLYLSKDDGASWSQIA